MGEIYEKVFNQRFWGTWEELKNDLEKLNIKYKKIRDIGNFKYDSIFISEKNLFIFLSRYEGLDVGKSKMIAKILDYDINLSEKEINELV